MYGTLYSIDPELGFMDQVASRIMADQGGAPDSLADTTVFVPGAGARGALQAAFLDLSGGRATILPRIFTLGDITGEIETLPPPLGAMQPVPVIDPLTRQAAFAQLITENQSLIDNTQPSARQIWQLAKALADLVDEFDMAAISKSDLEKLVPSELAHHWQQNLELLSVIFDQWPARRKALGGLDQEKARSETLARLAAHFERLTSNHGRLPLYIAGSTGSRPSVRRFMAHMVQRSAATIFLPGVDLDIPSEVIKALEPSHPEWALQQLLTEIGVDRDDIIPLSPAIPRDRVSLFREALAPASTTSDWHKSLYRTAAPQDLFSGIKMIEAPGQRSEAAAIALALREVADHPSRTAVLVTPDRTLAALVQHHLAVWDITIFDGAGQILDTTPQGRFLQASIEAIASDFKPAPLLGLLLHPLSHFTRPRDQLRRLARLLDKEFLRGPRPAGGLKGIKARVTASKALTAADKQNLIGLLTDLQSATTTWSYGRYGPYDPHSLRGDQPVKHWLVHHMRFAELAATNPESGGAADALYAGDIGRALSQFLIKLYAALPREWTCSLGEYTSLFDAFLKGQSIRLQRDQHPRLRIVGPLEVRNLSADLIILGGLNEQSWPAERVADPWLNKAMRKKLGLSPEDQQIGQSAHDFITASAKERVIITRSLKVGGSPTVMSRWLYRVEALAAHPIPRDTAYLAYADMLDRWQGSYAHHPALEIAKPPAPTPPVAARPTRLSVSDIQLWMRDPYALYAKRLLRLKPLDKLDADPGAADKGTLLHDALERFLKEDGPIKGEAGRQRLIALGRQVFADFKDLPTVTAFWWPRFLTLADAFISHGHTWWQNHSNILAEEEGSYRLPGSDFTVFARADRIDKTTGGEAVIIDYKTGSVPTGRQIAAGYAPQLPLEGLITRKGGFAAAGVIPVAALDYWVARGGKEPLDFKYAPKLAGRDVDTLIKDAEKGLSELVTRFMEEATPYLSNPRPITFLGGDYDHLARVKEWHGGDPVATEAPATNPATGDKA